MISDIGATCIDSITHAHDATHVIAADDGTSLRRTPKLMICVCRTSNILHMSWLVKSAEKGRPLPCNGHLLLNDTKAESTYNFSMKETLKNGIEVRTNQGGLLDGWKVFFCKGVAGHKAPSMQELRLIIDAAGGTVLDTLTTKEAGAIASDRSVLIVTSDPPTAAQKSQADKLMEKLGTSGRVETTSWLFQCIIRQKIDTAVQDGSDKGGKLSLKHTKPTLTSGSKRKLSSSNLDANEEAPPSKRRVTGFLELLVMCNH